MSDDREILKDFYRQCSESGCNSADLEEQLANFLEKNDRDVCFKLLPFYAAQKEFRKKIGSNVDWYHFEFAMENLERYTLNLITKPWCKDFCTIKIFTGFFRYNIVEWISFDIACQILGLIGYHKTAPGILSCDIDNLVGDRVLVVSFELCLARILTKLLRSGDSFKLKNHLTKKDLFNYQCPLPNLEDLSLRQTVVTTQEYKSCYDKDGQTADLTGMYNNTQEYESLSFNPDDLNDELLYGSKNDSSCTDNDLSNYIGGNIYQNGQDVLGYDNNTLTEKDERATDYELYENIPTKMTYEAQNVGTALSKSGHEFGQSTAQDLYRQHNIDQNIDKGPYSSMPVTLYSTSQYNTLARFNSKDDLNLKGNIGAELYTVPQQPSTLEQQQSVYMARTNNPLYENLGGNRNYQRSHVQWCDDDELHEKAGRVKEIMEGRIERAVGQKSSLIHCGSGSTEFDSTRKQKIVCSICSESKIVVFCKNCKKVYCQFCFKVYEKSKCAVGWNNVMHNFKVINKETLSPMENSVLQISRV